MGGTITVESVKGVGTVFTVSLPAAGQVAAVDDRRPRVLVVDDNDQAREIAVHTLADAFRIVTASNGDEALARIARRAARRWSCSTSTSGSRSRART